MPFLSGAGDGKLSRLGTCTKVATYPVTSTAVCSSAGMETCPRDSRCWEGHGIHVTMLQDEAGAWRSIHLFSASWEGFPLPGKLHQEGGVTTHDTGNHPALSATPKPHLEETREQTSTGWRPGASSELQRKQAHYHLPHRGLCPRATL